MSTWNFRDFFMPVSGSGDFSPAPLGGAQTGVGRTATLAAGFLLTFGIALIFRILELPFWDFGGFFLRGEHLLATHDAYHWVAGAEGFEFGVGHPLAELLRHCANLAGLPPAEEAFYLPLYLGALAGTTVFLWAWGMGRPCAGLVAGTLTSLAPSFLGRTLLGYFDTDLVVLPFAVLLGVVPGIWLYRRTFPPAALLRRAVKAGGREIPAGLPGGPPADAATAAESALTLPWLGLLILSGLFGWQTQEWHSLFPYLTRFSALLFPLLIVVCGLRGTRRALLRGALCHVLPLLWGLPGMVAAMLHALLVVPEERQNEPKTVAWIRSLLRRRWVILLLWLVIVLPALLNSEVGRALYDSFLSYAHRSGDVTSTGAAVGDVLVFPSVNRSIIETQLVEFPELLLHVYPARWLGLLALILFVRRLWTTPVMWWFAPLAALYLLSMKMGGRMSMFGAPPLLLALSLDVSEALERLARLASRKTSGAVQRLVFDPQSRFALLRRLAAFVVSAMLALFFCRPLADLIPLVTQGPILTQSQAQALSYLKEHSPVDSLVWNWWDWGYATHHFAQRRTIADGARHGGPSLFLPAAVYTTADPRFARQIIKYTALKGNDLGEVFHDLDAKGAQDLMRRLGDKNEPLIEAKGTQYLVVSFDLLRLGVWVSQYGSWNFETRASSGSYMNNLDTALAYNLDTGLIQADGGKTLKVGSIAVFDAQGLTVRQYPGRQGGFHFIFNPPRLDEEENFRRHFMADPLSSWWDDLEQVHPAVESNDKIAMDDVFYNTLMVQLLLCDKDDPRFSPYFKLVFDNTYARVFEVR